MTAQDAPHAHRWMEYSIRPVHCGDCGVDSGLLGWHGDGALCLGLECQWIDSDGDHVTADVHSNDWYEGYEQGQRERDAAPGPREDCDTRAAYGGDRESPMSDIFDRLMALWQEPWSEEAYGEAQMLLSRLRAVPPPAAPGLPAELRALSEAATSGEWAWFDDGPGSPYLATVKMGRVYVMGFARKGMQFAQPVFQVRQGNRPGSGVMQTAAEIGPNWKKHPDAALIVAAVNYVRALAETPSEPAHPRSCSSWFASDATTGEGICDCGLVDP